MASATWDARARLAWDKALRGARLALGVLLIACGCALAWLLAIAAAGALLVYNDAPAQVPPSTVTAEQALLPRLPDHYPFDDRPRAIDGAVSCPQVALGEYAGSSLKLVPPARVAAPFRERLVELERVVRETALPFYGRTPSALSIAASYDCRPITGNRKRLSEHALGNAIDITAVVFDADPVTGAAAFEVRVDRDWKADGDARHARFLRAMTEALIARNVFRTLLGPAHPDHQDHFHFDMAPQHYVDL